MDLVVERCAGLDVHKDTVVDAVRTPAADGGGRETEVRSFGTLTAELLELRDWLIERQVTLVAMESTGVYWKPVYYLLADAIDCWVVNARHIRSVPGCKTSPTRSGSSNWSCMSLVRPSFVPRRRSASAGR